MTDVTPPPAPQTAVPADSAAVPAAAPAAAPAATAPVRRKGRFPGVASLILALLAVIGDIAVFVIAIVGIASFASSFDPSTLDFSSGLTAFFGFAAFAAIAFWGGVIVAGLALLLGIIAIVSNRGRIPGIFGTIISILVLLTHLSIALAIGNIGAIPTDMLPS